MFGAGWNREKEEEEGEEERGDKATRAKLLRCAESLKEMRGFEALS